jgi:hypothetical protein
MDRIMGAGPARPTGAACDEERHQIARGAEAPPPAVIRKNCRRAELTRLSLKTIRYEDRPGSALPQLGSLLEPSGRLTH